MAPYHYRFDWQMWFASMSTPEDYPWTVTVIDKLLHSDPAIINLFAKTPFPVSPPRYIRAVLYRYSFTQPGATSGDYWQRTRLAIWLPATGLH